ncbi:LPS export ABC transporter permease LptG [Albidovulum sp.]|uniref:LPS export ABC transporter permease LptG n=1 Tax=Albidovulum sp. TaxID=1872424 RepID=UPI001D6DD358|nr:LPS export ABC transporter permease LptG [Paracoccaceae bacterium]MCC0046317.1 LPS export ABC transporter permease LptG [Defluviimonas sp.]HPE25788.1 LPS export ABC transporter permease LptG [Albidovulum sp.]MCP5355541.1 LPS export ABC transporter permease LptG [Paracoccaceae bacterium]MCP5377008.1 LPS export ABC transporter permease LptG [Paracoccaceae bacterium]
MTLTFYIARRFVFMFAAIFAGFLMLMSLVEMVEQVRRFSGIGLGQAAELAALSVPASIYRILPLIVILATVGLFLALARSSELVVIRAGGRSALVTLMAPVVTAALIGALAVAVLNPIAAGTTKAYELRSGQHGGSASTLSISGEGLWLRQGGPEGQTVIHAARANTDGTILSSVTFMTFTPDGVPARRIAAESAVLEPGGWRLSGAKEWPLAPGTNPEAEAVVTSELSLPSDLTADRIRDSFGQPATISIWDLPGFIDGLQKAGFSARAHMVWFQMELALPLLLVAMVLIGAGFTMRHVRFGRTGLMVLLAVSSGFAIFFLRNFAQVLGENGQIPVALAAWSTPVAAALLSIGLVLHMEEG